MKKLVNIGERKVPLLIGNGVTELFFRAGVHGKKERGYYRFWTAIGEDHDGPITVTGRARRSLCPGDRFARMSWKRTKKNPYSHRVIYRRWYRILNHYAFYVRPSTKRELVRWIDSHKKDMAFASAKCIICGKKARVPK